MPEPMSLVSAFDDLPDPRRSQGLDHRLTDLLLIAVCTLLSLVQRRPDFQSTVLWLCRRLMKPNAQSDRQHRKLLRYLKGSKDLATFFQTASEDTVIKDCVDGDWGCDELDRKSVSGGVVMVGGCRIHCHAGPRRHTPSPPVSLRS